MVDALLPYIFVVIMHMRRHLRLIFGDLIKQILLRLPFVAYIGDVASIFLTRRGIAEVAVDIGNGEAILVVGADATDAGAERDLDHEFRDVVVVIVFGLLDWSY
jgi:hypothetical protein